MKFSDKLAKQRKANNLSQEQLAESLGVTRQSVSKWESGDSYPDMAKIMLLCKLLNCPINDLLDDGVMGELPETEPAEPVKKNYLEDFLSYVTRSYNMFVHMTLKSKVKMIFELLFIAFLLFAIFGLLFLGIDLVARELIYLLPYVIAHPLSRLFKVLLLAAGAALGLLTFFHLFKIRYLDYYVTISDPNVSEQSEESPIEENTRSGFVKEPSHPTIVIRDPKHSSSRFFQFLGKIFRFILNAAFTLFIELPAAGLLIVSAGTAAFCLAFSGSFFKFTSLAAIGAAVLFGLVVYVGYNYLFGRKQPHRPLVIVLLCGLLVTGVGGGLCIGAMLNLKEIDRMEGIEEVTESYDLTGFRAEDILDFYSVSQDEIIYRTDPSVKEGIRLEILHPELTTVEFYGPHRYNEEQDYYHFGSYQSEFSAVKRIREDISSGMIRSDYGFYKDCTVYVYANANMLQNIKKAQEQTTSQDSTDEEYTEEE